MRLKTENKVLNYIARHSFTLIIIIFIIVFSILVISHLLIPINEEIPKYIIWGFFLSLGALIGYSIAFISFKYLNSKKQYKY